MTVIHELSIGGGGIKGLAFVGALYELEKRKLLNDLKKISGTSIGGFLASCLTIGLKVSHLIDNLFEYDYRTIKDVELKKMFSRKSILKGEKLRQFYRDIISIKEDPYITLKDLYSKTNIELIITVTCLNTQEVEYISHKTDPDLDLFTLICMSSAIPGILPPVSYKNKIYVDGCLLDNLPISHLSNGSWGITSKSRKKEIIDTKEMNTINYFSTILKIIHNSQNTELKREYNIIEVDIGNVEVTSFNVTKDEKLKLIKKGIQSVIDYFNDHFSGNQIQS